MRLFDERAPVSIELAKVLDVFPDTYTCHVITIAGHRELTAKFAVPVLGQDRGGGLNFMPVPESFCYVAIPGDGTGSFILGFTEIENPDENQGSDTTDSDDPSYAGERPRLEPGDIALTTKDGNFIYVRRGGIVQIGASQLAQRIYIPVENIVRDYYQRYHGFSPIGEMIWEHSLVTEDALNDGDISAIVKFSCKEKIQDASNSVEVRVGHLGPELLDATINSNLLQEGNPDKIGDEAYTGDGDEEHVIGNGRKVDGLGFNPDPNDMDTVGMLSITVNPQGAGAVYKFQISKDGSNFIRAEGHIHIETNMGYFVSATPEEGIRHQVDKDIFTEIKDYIKAQVNDALLEILSNGDIKLAGNNIQLDAEGNVTIKAPTKILLEAAAIVLNGDVSIGEGASQDVLIGASVFKDALENHQHGYINGVTPATTTPLGFPILPAAKTSSQSPKKLKIG